MLIFAALDIVVVMVYGGDKYCSKCTFSRAGPLPNSFGQKDELVPPFLHEGVVTWVLKKAGPPAIELETVEAAMAFEKENRLSLLARVFVS